MKNEFPGTSWVKAPNFEVSSQIKDTARAQRKRGVRGRQKRTEGQQICSRYADDSDLLTAFQTQQRGDESIPGLKRGPVGRVGGGTPCPCQD